MQQNDVVKKKQAEAFETIENWTLRQYYFNMIQYALKKQLVLPFIEFTINGQPLFRLLIEEEEEEEDDDEDEGTVNLDFVIKYFGSQKSFIKQQDPIEFYTLTDGRKMEKCILPGFKLVIEDDETPSNLCFGTSVGRVSQQNLEKALDMIRDAFKLLQDMEAKKQFENLPDICIERIFSITSHDNAKVAYEVVEKIDDGNEGLKHKNEKLEQEWREAEERSKVNAKIIDQYSTVSSCQLHADIWQRNEKLRMTAIGRQYEDLASLAKIGDAMHVRFRGADEDLQKRICIGELLVNLLPTLVMNCFD